MRKVTILLLFISFTFLGCSSGGNPVVPVTSEQSGIIQNTEPGSLDKLPVFGLTQSCDGSFNATGLIGASELIIDTRSMSAELVSKRLPALGESWIVSGMNYFTLSPCSDCVKIKSVSLTPDGNILLTFNIRHPLKAGDSEKPPTRINRLDLDIFDPALVFCPSAEWDEISWDLIGGKTPKPFLTDADGYTSELSNMLKKNIYLPYVLIVDNDGSTTPNFNKLPMGGTASTVVEFDTASMGEGKLCFDMYMTMGYGASAKGKNQRLVPEYYNPEFNRKAAWKVVVTPPEGTNPPARGNTWYDLDSATKYNVTVKVFDWQQGVTSIANPPVNTGYIASASNVVSVSVEIPGMTNELKSVTVNNRGVGTPTDPLIYTIPIANERSLAAGEYVSLVKVTDSRIPQTVPGGDIDFLVDAEADGSLINYEIPEFATYQTFIATVVTNYPPVWNGTIGIQSAVPGNARTTITFGTATDPDGDNPVTYDLFYVDQTSTGNSNPFVAPNTVRLYITSPYLLHCLTNTHTYYFGVRATDSKGLSETNTVNLATTLYNDDLMWAKRAGGTECDYASAITVLSDTSTVVTGRFSDTVTFGPGETNQTVLHCLGDAGDMFIAKYNPDGTLAWAKSAGGVGSQGGYSITTLSDNSTVVTGYFCGITIFGLGETNQTVLNVGTPYNIFIAKYNPNGTLAWVKYAGCTGDSDGEGITTLSDNSTVVTGTFCRSATFGPGEATQITLISDDYAHNIFIAKYNPDGTLAWAKQVEGFLGFNYGSGITSLSDNTTVVTGCFYETATFGPGETNPIVLTSAGDYDIFIAKYNLDGTLLWVKQAGGTVEDYGYGITVHSDNSTVVTGYFCRSATFGPGEPGSITLTALGITDVFIAKYNSDGTLAWAKSAGGSVEDIGYSITALSDNSTVVTGSFCGSATFGPSEPGEKILTTPGDTDIFIAKLDPNGTLVWARSVGGSNTDISKAIIALSDDSTVMTGYFEDSVTFGPDEAIPITLTSAGAEDIFIARYSN